MIPLFYGYTDIDWEWCERYGALMDAKNVRADTVDLVGGVGTHRIGLLGAYAYAAVSGIPLSLEIYARHGDGGANFLHPDGRSVDVMVSRIWRDPYLKQFPKAVPRTDLYVLVALDELRRRAWVMGQATHEAVARAGVWAWGGGEPVHNLRWAELEPLDTVSPDYVQGTDWRAEAAGRAEDRAAERDERRRQDLLRFRAEQHNRMAFIHAGLDKRQPPEYRGQVFDMGTNQGVAYFGTPPYRDDPQGPLTEEFIAFQEYDGHRIRRENPEYYCTECGMRYASGRCPSCKSGRVIEREAVEAVGEDGLIGMECKSCGTRFRGEVVCGPCLSTRPEVIKEMAEEKARKQRTRGRGGSVVPDPILYPD